MTIYSTYQCRPYAMILVRNTASFCDVRTVLQAPRSRHRHDDTYLDVCDIWYHISLAQKDAQIRNDQYMYHVNRLIYLDSGY
jgi:hypothetical protein